MSATLTATIDRSLTISPRLLACQGEMAVALTVNVDTDIRALASGKNAYLYFLLPNGDAFYKGEYDASSGSFGVTLGFTDHVLSYAGEAYVQLVIADDAPSDATEMWKTEMCAFIVAPSISAVLPASYYTVPTITVPTTFPAENVVVADALNIITATNVEDTLQEVVTQINILNNTVNVKDYGAMGDGTTDDTVSINSAIAVAELADNAVLHFPSGAGYLTTETIEIPDDVSVIMDAPIIYDGELNETALQIGTSSSISTYAKYELWVTKKVQSDWTDNDCIGIKLINLCGCNVHIREVIGFTIGLYLIGSGTGFAYNNFTIQHLYNNKYQMWLTNSNSGWINENIYIGGRLHNQSAVNLESSRYGVVITSEDESYVSNNANLFIKTSFELTVPDTGEALPVDIIHGRYNRFESCRHEINNVTFARIANTSTQNEFDLLYGLSGATVEDSSDFPSSKVYTTRTKQVEELRICAFDSQKIHKNACYSDGATDINVPRLAIFESGNANISYQHTGMTLNANYLEVPVTRGIGCFLSSIKNKTFMVKQDSDTGYGGRIRVACYDSDGALLTSESEGYPHLKGLSGMPFSYAATYGGTYYTGSDSESDKYFTVSTEVCSIRIMVSGGTAALRIRSYQVFARDASSTSWLGYEEIMQGVNLGTAAPSAGTWAVGRRIINAVPTVGQPKAWICTVAGEPGTWVSEGNL